MLHTYRRAEILSDFGVILAPEVVAPALRNECWCKSLLIVRILLFCRRKKARIVRSGLSIM